MIYSNFCASNLRNKQFGLNNIYFKARNKQFDQDYAHAQATWGLQRLHMT